MKVPEIIQENTKTLFSFELLPPLKGNSIKQIYDAIDPLMEYNPAYINVTYHQQEVIYQKQKNGLLKPKAVRKRPGTVAISSAIMHKYKMQVMPHLICGGFSQEDTEDALIDLNFLGIKNILAIRGDIQKGQNKFIDHSNGHEHALGLVKQISALNKGMYLDEELQNKKATNFCVGVAAYPEKHTEAPNMEIDIHFLKKKIEAGAEFIITQLFFDNKKFFDFVQKCRENNINVPIIPGIKPITTIKQLYSLPKIFNIDIPNELAKEMLNCKNDENIKQIGIEWAIKQSKELIKAKVPIIHYYTMGKATSIKKIIKIIF